MSAPDLTVLGLAESMPQLLAERAPRRWTVGIILACRCGVVVLAALGVLVDATLGWRQLVAALMVASLAAGAAVMVAEMADDWLLDKEQPPIP